MATTIDKGSASTVAALIAQGAPASDQEFSTLYRHFKPAITSYATRTGAADPEGVANLALFEGITALDRLENRTEAAFEVYLRRVARHYVTREHRRSHPEPTAIDDDALLLEDHADQVTDHLWLRELIEELPPDQQAVIKHRFYDDLSGSATGSRLEKDPNAVYQLQHRAIGRLRRTIFAAVVVIVAVIGLAAVRQALVSNQVDSTPVDRIGEPDPVETEPPATTVPEAERRETPDTAIELGADESSVAVVDQGRIETQAETTATTAGQAGPQPSTEEGSTTTVVAQPGPTPTTAPAPPATTAAPTIPVAPAPVPAATPMNVCAPHLLNLTMSAFKLYNPGGAGSRVAAFNPPAAVRFLDAQGNVIHRVDTSGPMVTSTAAGAHGWVGAGSGSGTYANYADAPNPTFWAVLATQAQTEGRAAIQTLDASTNTWTNVPGCN